jgi:hypothetical protein
MKKSTLLSIAASLTLLLLLGLFIFSKTATSDPVVAATFVKAPLFSGWDYRTQAAGVLETSIKKGTDGGTVNVTYEQSSLSLKLPFTGNQLAQTADNKLSFTTPQGITTTYQVEANRIKEEIILNSPTTIHQPLTTPLTTTNLDIYLTPDNLPVFFDSITGDYRFHIEAPFAIDAKGNKTYAASYQLKAKANPPTSLLYPQLPDSLILMAKPVKVSTPNQQYVLELTIDPSWLNHPDRVYPITIDPTITHDTQSDFASGSLNRIKDTGADDDNPQLEAYYQEVAADPYTVGLWHFNETSGNALDSSGNNNTGTPTGTTIVDGMFGKARSFNGSSDHIIITDSNSLDVSTNITIDFWVKSSGANTSDTGLVFKSLSSSYAVTLAGTSGSNDHKLYFNIGATYITTTKLFNDNQWHHVACIYDGSTMAVYIDGSLDVSGVKTGAIGTDANNIYLGSRNSAGTYFSGSLDEIRISSIARSPEEIRASAQRRPSAIYTSPVIDTTNAPSSSTLSWTSTGASTGNAETASSSTGLIAQWNFNEASGTTAASGGSCGATCNGTLTNFADTTGQDVAVGSGWTSTHRRWGTGALMLNGSTDYVVITDNDSIKPTSSITINMWLKLNAYPGSAAFIVDHESSSPWYGYNTYVLSDKKVYFEFYTTSNTAVGSKTLLDLNTWYNITAVYDGSQALLYINGKLDNSLEKSGSINYASSVNLTIGRRSPFADSFLTGFIDSVQLYSRALTANEILSNYNASRLDFQTRSSDDGSVWEAWKPSTGETVLDPLSTLTTAWKVDTYPSSSSTVALTGAPDLGDGADGAITVSANANLNTDTIAAGRSCADGGDAVSYSVTSLASAGSTSITTSTTPASGCFSVGDEIIIINMQGTSTNFDSVGLYETHTLTNVSGATLSFTDYPLRHTYSGTNQKIMVQRIPNYTNVTINNGQTLTINAWDGTKGGLLFFRATGTVTVSGTIDVSGKGYRGGNGNTVPGAYSFGPGAFQGESYSGTGIQSQSATGSNGGGGGGGRTSTAWAEWQYGGGGGGGSYGNKGVDGGTSASGHAGGTKGERHNYTQHNRIFLGSGGGGAGQGVWGEGGNGATGGGAVVLYADTISLTGSMNVGGNQGSRGAGGSAIHEGGAGGAGSGGFLSLYATSLSLNTNLATANGGATQTSTYGGGGSGGLGGSGHILITYTDTYSGSTSPNAYIKKVDSIPTSDSVFSVDVGKPLVDPATAGFWRFNESGGTGAYLKDSSGNGNHGTPTGTTVIDGIIGKARSFPGGANYVQAPLVATQTQFVTLEGWLYWKGTSEAGYIFYNGSGGSNGYGLLVSNGGCGSGSSVYLLLGGITCSGLSAAYPLPRYQWTHLALTRDHSTWSLYVNGALYTTGSAGPHTPSASTTIGNGLTGILDEVRFSTVARSAEEIMESYRMGRDHRIGRTINPVDLSTTARIPFWFASDALGSPLEFSYSESAFAQGEPDANTVGLWRLEESAGSGAYLKDSSGNGHHATPTGTTFTQGKIGKARYSPGTSGNHIDTSTDSAFDFATENFSVGLWVKQGSSGIVNNMIGKWDGASGWYMQFQSGNTLFFDIYTNASNYLRFTSTQTFTDTTNWHHYFCQRTSVSNIDCYRNGIKIPGSVTSSGTASANSNSNLFITGYSTAGLFIGTIDEVRVDNIARTPEEIRQAYELGKRSHVVTVDFKAKLDSGNLITDTNDLSFTIDETAYGSSAKANHLFVEDKLIVKENYDGTEYLAQGEVSSVTPSTGAVTVTSWDTGSTFPSSGFSQNATVFKWQQEYMDLSGSLPSHRNAVTHLGYRLLDGSQGRTIWLDDLKYSGSYLSDPSGSTITSTPARYFQYRTILTSSDPAVSAGFSAVSLNYTYNLDAPAPCNASFDYQTNTVDLSWTDTNTAESGYLIERKVDASEFAAFQTLAADSASYNDSTIAAGSQYTYRIRAYYTDTPTVYSDYCTTDTVAFNQGSFTFGGGLKLDGIRIY